jgi:Uma2 family endonuclease
VREYWLVDPTNRIITVYSHNKSNKFQEYEIYASDDNLTSAIFPDLTIDFKKVFPPLP